MRPVRISRPRTHAPRWGALRLGVGAWVVFLVAVGAASGHVWGPRLPFPQSFPYAPGTLYPAHRTAGEQADDVRALYDRWRGDFIAGAGSESDGHPRYRVRIGATAMAPTVSEGQGYGMLFVVLLAGHDPDAQIVFDGLWEFALDHPSVIDGRLLDWWIEADEGPDPYGDDSAFDGDCQMAFALLLAEAQWGNGGRFHYGAEAARVLDALLESAIGPTSNLPLLGDWVTVAGPPFSEWTPRPSDFMLHAFRAFARATREPAWLDVAAAAQSVLAEVRSTWSPVTALVPDFLEPVTPGGMVLRPADPWFLESPFDGDYYYNSLRVPLWLGVDALLSGDPGSSDHAAALASWIAADVAATPIDIPAGYSLDGTPLPGSNYFTTAFVAPVGVASMRAAGLQVWIESVYEAVRESDEGYYEDSISLLSLLAMTGHFWTPDLVPRVGDAVWTLFGVAAGGRIELTLEGVSLRVFTTPGETATEVAWQLAMAINQTPELSALAVTASANASSLITNGSLTRVLIDDPGLVSSSSPIPVLPGVWGGVLGLGLGMAACVILRRRRSLRDRGSGIPSILPR